MKHIPRHAVERIPLFPGWLAGFPPHNDWQVWNQSIFADLWIGMLIRDGLFHNKIFQIFFKFITLLRSGSESSTIFRETPPNWALESNEDVFGDGTLQMRADTSTPCHPEEEVPALHLCMLPFITRIQSLVLSVIQLILLCVCVYIWYNAFSQFNSASHLSLCSLDRWVTSVEGSEGITITFNWNNWYDFMWQIKLIDWLIAFTFIL